MSLVKVQIWGLRNCKKNVDQCTPDQRHPSSIVHYLGHIDWKRTSCCYCKHSCEVRRN